MQNHYFLLFVCILPFAAAAGENQDHPVVAQIKSILDGFKDSQSLDAAMKSKLDELGKKQDDLVKDVETKVNIKDFRQLEAHFRTTVEDLQKEINELRIDAKKNGFNQRAFAKQEQDSKREIRESIDKLNNTVESLKGRIEERENKTTGTKDIRRDVEELKSKLVSETDAIKSEVTELTTGQKKQAEKIANLEAEINSCNEKTRKIDELKRSSNKTEKDLQVHLDQSKARFKEVDSKFDRINEQLLQLTENRDEASKGIQNATVNKAPEILIPEPNVIVPEGGECTLRCLTKENQIAKLTWHTDTIIFGGSNGRHRLLSNGSLQLVGVTREDSGLYFCSAEFGDGNKASGEIRVEVTEGKAVSAAILNTESAVRVNMASPAVLFCHATGWPRPSVTWWRSGAILPMASRRYKQRPDFALVISSVAFEDLGPYTCQAYNGLARAASWTVTLQGYKPPEVAFSGSEPFYKFLVDPNNVGASLPRFEHNATTTIPRIPVRVNVSSPDTSYSAGSNLTITCQVEGSPIHTIVWFKDGMRIVPSDRVIFSDSNTLTIKHSEASDGGNYACEASNSDGSERGSAAIQITVDTLQIHPNCTDRPLHVPCKLIVSLKYCTVKYYSRFCCRSCTEAGQLPVDGARLFGN